MELQTAGIVGVPPGIIAEFDFQGLVCVRSKKRPSIFKQIQKEVLVSALIFSKGSSTCTHTQVIFRKGSKRQIGKKNP